MATRSTSAGSQLAASAVGDGTAAARSRSSQRSPRTPTGPSDTTIWRSPICGSAYVRQKVSPVSSLTFASRSSRSSRCCSPCSTSSRTGSFLPRDLSRREAAPNAAAALAVGNRLADVDWSTLVPQGSAGALIELALGVLLLGWAVFRLSRPASHAPKPRRQRGGAFLLLGAGWYPATGEFLVPGP